MSRISNDELRRLIECAYPNPWDFGETISLDGQEWYGCGVTSANGNEFVWLENEPETDNPTARLIALSPALAAEVLQLRATLRAITATDCYSRDECTEMARAALSADAMKREQSNG